MEPGFDHVTLAVTDLEEACHFFEMLGFKTTTSTVVSGEEMSRYMGIEGWEADHVTLRHEESPVHQEVQLLRFHHPVLEPDESAADLARTGFNHVCFRVTDLRGLLERIETAGIEARSGVMHFHDRDLVLLRGPAGAVIELAEWR